MTYTDFESNLAAESNKKQNPDVPYSNKYQNHLPCIYGYKLEKTFQQRTFDD